MSRSNPSKKVLVAAEDERRDDDRQLVDEPGRECLPASSGEIIAANDFASAGHEAVVRQAEAEQRRRFDVLFASYGADIVAYCHWRADSASDAEDAVADVFLTAWRRLDAVPEGDDARVWLYATARRVLANQRRSRRRRSALHERLALQAGDGSRGAKRRDPEQELVHDALRRLGERDREVLLLAEWEGLSPAQIAAVLGCLTVTARGRLHRARRRFRAVFEELRAEQPSRERRPSARHVHEGGS